MNPIHHTNDPPTSRRAAEHQDRSGKRQRHCDMVMDLVRRFPGSTAIELWEHATLDERIELKEPQRVRQRLTDLRAAGRVFMGAERKCLVRNTSMVTWVAAEDPSRQRELFQ